MPQETTVANAEQAPYVSAIDTRPLTDKEKIAWWVLGIMGAFSLLFLMVLMALMHSPLAAG